MASRDAALASLRFEDLDFVYVELTVKCNLRCHFCDNEMRNLYRDMPAPQFRRIVDQLKPGTRLGLHGLGEPTLHKELLELIGYAKQRDLYVYFNTNHTVTTDAQMQGFVDRGLDELRISMSAGTREGFAAYAGKDLFADLTARVRRMVEIRGRGRRPLLRLVFVLTRQSRDEFPRVVRFADEVGVDELQVQTHLDWGKPPTPDEPPGGLALDEDELSAARRIVVDATATVTRVKVILPFPKEGPVFDSTVRPGHCQWPFNATWITADGEVTPCCNLHDPRQIRFGNAFTEPLATVWLNDAYREFRVRYRADAVTACHTCPVHWGRFKSYTYGGDAVPGIET
jgi:radical SAM protein with 4Fe4S-binding SPASM domain